MGRDFDKGSNGGTKTAVTVSDLDIIEMVRGGDSDAFDTLYRRHLAAAQYVARAQTDNASDADDAVAEAFASVFQALSNGKGPKEFFRAYLLTAVQRIAHARNRKARSIQTATDEATLDTAVVDDDPIINEFESSAVAAAFKSLPERWQAVLWHIDVEGLKPAAAAPLIGLSPNGVSSLVLRAREGLRQAYLQNHLVLALDDECSEFSSQLGKYARHALKRTSRERVSVHLETCSKCTALLIELNDIQGAMKAALFPLVTGIALTPGAAAGLLSASNVSALTGQGVTTVRSINGAWKVAVAAVAAVGLATFGLAAWFGQPSGTVSTAGDAPSNSATPPAPVPTAATLTPTLPPVVEPSATPSSTRPSLQFPPAVAGPQDPAPPEALPKRAAVVTDSGTVTSATEASPELTDEGLQTVDAAFASGAGYSAAERDVSVSFSLLGQGHPSSGEAIFSLSGNAAFILGKFSAPPGWACSDPAADSHRIRCTSASFDPAGLTFGLGVSLQGSTGGGTLNYQFGGQNIVTKSFASGFH
ncbi:sigma-70 family RNA polymerase sigma factor [Paenarthrobacter sp. NPDC092416]|uniref:sigma-70 family RNA polymerase sigma factor n=1 Tax=Paenarthrobacter sp. NPDC092416 TaxID=3364386 RepID=UPI0037FCE01A